MSALVLTTRFRESSFETEACLLVYDEDKISPSDVGEDVRRVLDHKPNTRRIYVLAPFVREAMLMRVMTESVGRKRAGVLTHGDELSIIGFRKAARILKGASSAIDCMEICSWAVSNDFDENLLTGGEQLSKELIEGWLFNLFDVYRGRVHAPPGVHFGKASTKHADKFLRVSNLLLSTGSCAVVAFFAFSLIQFAQPRRIFVDTAPLISVALSMFRIANVRGLWDAMPSTKSFSSYGGVENLPPLARSDLILISASTSGGLAERLVHQMGASEASLVTLFYLGPKLACCPKGSLLCDLTFFVGRTFGYPPIVNHLSTDCDLCAKGYVLAPLEGDQFLLEHRGLKKLEILKASQPDDARIAAKCLTGQAKISVALQEYINTQRTDIIMAADKLLAGSKQIREDFFRHINRFTPTPLSLVVLVGWTKESFASIMSQAGMPALSAGVEVVDFGELSNVDKKDGGNTLVLIGYLSDPSIVRGVNTQLRSKVPGGAVAYISLVTIADSPRALADLKIFLTYGERGHDSFTFKSAVEFMLPWGNAQPSPWTQELELMRRLVVGAPAVQVRLDYLSENSHAREGIFFPGKSGPLKIQRDFVFLDTASGVEDFSQADIYAVVSNVLAAARCNNTSLLSPIKRDSAPLIWEQTVYGQVVLSPENFGRYSDSILQAAMLRAAFPSELNYSVDEECSNLMSLRIQALVDGWKLGIGEALPEFLISLATGRLKLSRRFLDPLLIYIREAKLPKELSVIAESIEI